MSKAPSQNGWAFQIGDKGPLEEGPLLSLRTLLWAALLFGSAVSIFFAIIAPPPWLQLPASFARPEAIIVPLATLVIYCLGVKLVEKRSASELLTRNVVQLFMAGYSIGTAWIAALIGVLWSFGLYQISGSTWSNAIDDFIYDGYISGVLEELAFRAIALRLLARLFGPIPALILSSVLFGLAHLGHATWLAAFEVALNGGIVLGLLYMTTGSLWAPIGMHIAWDFTETSVFGVNNPAGLFTSAPVRGTSDILTGGSFGPDASILASLLGAAIIYGLLRYRRYLQWA